MCLSIGAPRTINFAFVAHVKKFFRCPKIWPHYSLNIMYLNIGTNGKLMVLGVPILKHFRIPSPPNSVTLGSRSYYCDSLLFHWA